MSLALKRCSKSCTYRNCMHREWHLKELCPTYRRACLVHYTEKDLKRLGIKCLSEEQFEVERIANKGW